MKLIDCIERAAAQLDAAGVAYGQGTLCAFDEAAWLVLWRLGLALDALGEHAARMLGADELRAIDACVRQRIDTRRPTAYLTGEAWLQGVPFHVDERVIVPRSLIAEVIAEGLLEPWLPAPGPRHVLDLCTGSASLAVLAALAWPGARIDASDVSGEALQVAAINIRRHAVADRIRLLEGDGLQAVTGLYDLVLCNPPYVNRSTMASLPPEFRAEPAIALDGGVDGMDFIRRLMQQLPNHLAGAGALVLEIGHERGHFEAAFPTVQPLWLETSAGADAVLLLTREMLG